LVDGLNSNPSPRAVIAEKYAGIAGHWWQQLPADPSHRWGDRASSYDAYRFGDGIFEVGGSERVLPDYIRYLYADCRFTQRDDERLPVVRCTVSPTEREQVVRVEFEDPEPLDSMDFLAAVYGGRGYRECFSMASGWRCLAQHDEPAVPAVALRGSIALIDRRKRWHPLIAHLGINRLLHCQREMLFFHAASLTIRGAGALLFGDKCAGKTTTALFLAARGHGLLSDEVGAVHSGDNALAPFRRALSIRPGPIPDIVRGRLQSGDFRREILADGTSRIRARIGSLFHLNSAAATPLKCMFFLSGFAAMPRVRRITPGTEHLAHLQPFGSSMYGVSKRDAVFQLANMLARTQVYALTLGPPDATAALIEGIMEKT
jgi:hypothetical protein